MIKLTLAADNRKVFMPFNTEIVTVNDCQGPTVRRRGVENKFLRTTFPVSSNMCSSCSSASLEPSLFRCFEYT